MTDSSSLGYPNQVSAGISQTCQDDEQHGDQQPKTKNTLHST
jgi:hypothetical protein